MPFTRKRNPQLARIRRHGRIRRDLSGTAVRPRLAVFRSLNHIYAQLIDDQSGRTLAAASTLEPAVRPELKGSKSERATHVGQLLAKRAQEQGIKEVVFDRGGFLYHGRVRALAEGARTAGLQF